MGFSARAKQLTLKRSRLINTWQLWSSYGVVGFDLTDTDSSITTTSDISSIQAGDKVESNQGYIQADTSVISTDSTPNPNVVVLSKYPTANVINQPLIFRRQILQSDGSLPYIGFASYEEQAVFAGSVGEQIYKVMLVKDSTLEQWLDTTEDWYFITDRSEIKVTPVQSWINSQQVNHSWVNYFSKS